MKMQKLKIVIEIEQDNGTTTIVRDNFDKAILDLINEREWFNYWKKEEDKKLLNKDKRR